MKGVCAPGTHARERRAGRGPHRCGPLLLWSFAFVFFKYLLLYAIILSCMCFKALMFVYKIAVCN